MKVRLEICMSNTGHSEPSTKPSPIDTLGPTLHPAAPPATGVGVGHLRYSVCIPADWLVSHTWTPSAPPAASARKKSPAKRKVQAVDELAQRRLANQLVHDEQQRIEAAAFRRADDLFVEHAMACVSVPLHTVAVVGTLGAAAVLQAIAQASDLAYETTASPWVLRSEREWTDAAGVGRDEWIDARHRLRQLNLIQERRRYDEPSQQIVTEFAFDPEGWRAELTKARDEFVETLIQTEGAALLKLDPRAK